MAETIKKLDGKVSIVTGGASGIGEATARVFADHGALMVVIADIQDDLGQRVALSIGAEKCRYKHCDVTDPDQVEELVNWTIQNYGRLDIMFSNAGTASRLDQTVLDLDFSEMDRVFAVNVRGMTACVKYAARAMIKSGTRGSIVCTASVAASCASLTLTDYFMSKYAVLGLVRSASKQLGSYQIRVNSVSPFGVATPGVCGKMGMDVEEAEKFYKDKMCLEGTALKVKHIADAVSFLASDDSELITGHDLVVDGGFLFK